MKRFICLAVALFLLLGVFCSCVKENTKDLNETEENREEDKDKENENNKENEKDKEDEEKDNEKEENEDEEKDGKDENGTIEEIDTKKVEEFADGGLTDFSMKLLSKCFKGKSITVSPVSVIYALAMCERGASGNTLAQMETMLGINRAELLDYLKTYLNKTATAPELKIANSIWTRDINDIRIDPDFEADCQKILSAQSYLRPFDENTVAEINKWVSDNTDKMIEKILDETPESNVAMYLINALCFEALWETQCPYTYKDVFNDANGNKVDAEYISSTEKVYVYDDNTVGFMKDYQSGRFAFLALLPDKSIDIKDYVASLDKNKLAGIMKNKETATVSASFPKFTTEYKILLNDILIDLGMTDAFDENIADFTDMATLASKNDNLYVSKVIHKTFIDVSENGTKAAAVTEVEMAYKSALSDYDYYKVHIDRPFVYMIVDTQSNTPLFCGVQTTAGKSVTDGNE